MKELQMNLLQKFRFGLGRNTVRILLDLDGVIAPTGIIREGKYNSFDGDGYATWQVRNNVIEWMQNKQADNKVELVWSSTWQYYANSILEKSEMEPIAWIEFDKTYQTPGDWYKGDGLKMYMEGNADPIVIVDDELPQSFMDMRNPRVLCIKPEPNAGISDEELARIDKFIEDYRKRKIVLRRSI